MDLATLWATFVNWASTYSWQVFVTLAIVGLYFLVDRLTIPILARSADIARLTAGAGDRAVRISRLLTGTVCALAIMVVWGVQFGAVLVFAGTALTLLGVALFASWSILSNITAYFVILMQPAFRRGTFIRILDADNYAEGYIADLGLFNLKLITENREAIVYPNNLLLGRPCVINPRDRLRGVGKLPPMPAVTVPSDNE